jgi:hypothetical protein
VRAALAKNPGDRPESALEFCCRLVRSESLHVVSGIAAAPAIQEAIAGSFGRTQMVAEVLRVVDSPANVTSPVVTSHDSPPITERGAAPMEAYRAGGYETAVSHSTNLSGALAQGVRLPSLSNTRPYRRYWVRWVTAAATAALIAAGALFAYWFDWFSSVLDSDVPPLPTYGPLHADPAGLSASSVAVLSESPGPQLVEPRAQPQGIAGSRVQVSNRSTSATSTTQPATAESTPPAASSTPPTLTGVGWPQNWPTLPSSLPTLPSAFPPLPTAILGVPLPSTFQLPAAPNASGDVPGPPARFR